MIASILWWLLISGAGVYLGYHLYQTPALLTVPPYPFYVAIFLVVAAVAVDLKFNVVQTAQVEDEEGPQL